MCGGRGGGVEGWRGGGVEGWRGKGGGREGGVDSMTPIFRCYEVHPNRPELKSMNSSRYSRFA